MNELARQRYRAEAQQLSRKAAPVVNLFDDAYMKQAHRQGVAQRTHEARVQSAYKKAAELRAATERDWRRTKAMFSGLAILTAATAMANLFGMWGQFFG